MLKAKVKRMLLYFLSQYPWTIVEDLKLPEKSSSS